MLANVATGREMWRIKQVMYWNKAKVGVEVDE